jgi:site-specific DNA recombinase
MRVAIYARFSSDLQDSRSITDQIGAVRDYAGRQGWKVVAEFCDAAISGSSLHNRLLDLLVAAQQRQFDAVLTESIDRLSRDLEDIAGLHKRLAYWGVKIVTLADGEVGKLHVGLKGIIASIDLDDLAQKTRRGQVGRVKAGRIPGGRCYGYDVVREGDERGRRTVNEAEAEIVRRIFREYVDASRRSRSRRG